MLNDDERNRAYDNAIHHCVTHLVRSKVANPQGNRFYKCCDIGTGSGLLSMMVVRSFKRYNYENFHVQAYEAFQPMAECAKKVIEYNGMSKYITVIPARSDHYKTHENPQFDLLVAELLDTELIGEGCIEAYRHAVQNLCSLTCLFVPYAARIYVEPVASAQLFSRHSIDTLEFLDTVGPGNHVRVIIPDKVKNCPGMPEIDDMQVSALKEGEDFMRFSRPQLAFRLAFGNLDSLKLSDYKMLQFPVEREVTEPPVLIMWWDLVMYDSSLDTLPVRKSLDNDQYSWEVLSCAPNWARSAELLARDQFIKQIYGREVWREHWIQGVYYFASVRETKAGRWTVGQQLTIHAYHDTHSLWFDLKPCLTKLAKSCECGLHRSLSRSQLAFLSEPSQMRALLHSTLHRFCRRSPDSSEENPVFIQGKFDFHRLQHKALGDTVNRGYGPMWSINFESPGAYACGCPESIRVLSTKLDDLAIAGEVPWERILMKFLIERKLPEPVQSFDIKFTQVQFDNLNRIRTNRDECEGFNLSYLDDMINYSSKYVDKELEANYLYEYPCTRIDTTDYTVFSWPRPLGEGEDEKTARSSRDKEREKIFLGTYWRHFSLPIFKPEEAAAATAGAGLGNSWKKGWALAFWVEIKLKHTKEILSLGTLPTIRPEEFKPNYKLGTRMEWNRNCKQMVYFLHDHPIVAPPTVSATDERPSIHLDIGLHRSQLIIQRAVDYNTSPLKSKRRPDAESH